MANQLKMAMVNAIWILNERSWSQRRIARELGINCETVGKYFNLWRDGPKPAINAPTGSEGSKAAKAPLGSVGQDVFRIILSFSWKGYSEVVYHQSTDNFIRSLEIAFWHFGGVFRTLVIDNLKAAVKNADWYDQDIHPKIQSFCEHYGTVILPTKPYMPRQKGKIERGI